MKQKLAAEECTVKPITTYYSPSPQYIPSYEEEPPNLIRDLIPGPGQENNTSTNSRKEYEKGEERKTILELLAEEINLNYYSESDSDSEYRFQTLV